MSGRSRVTFQVFRFDPDSDREPRYDLYEVEVREGMTVLEGLFEILEKQDPSLAFRYACRGAVCGSCAMFINSSFRLACQTPISRLKSPITINPLPHLAIIKDVVADMTPFFDRYEKVMPYFITHSPPPERERLQTPQQRKAVDNAIDCILCAACYSACPMTWTNKEYLGPAALTKVYRFVADSRDEAREERLRLVQGEDGLWRCHTVFNCVEACPKKINQTHAIEGLRRRTLTQRLKFW